MSRTAVSRKARRTCLYSVATVHQQTMPAAAKFTVLALVLLLAGGCERAPRGLLELHGATMGTAYSVKVARPPARLDAENLEAGVEAVLERVNASMSNWRDDAEISQFNHSSTTGWVPVSAELAEVVAAAQEVSRASGGAFDVTVAPLVELWGFGPSWRLPALPPQDELERARARVGYDRIEVRSAPPALRKRTADATIDLAAIAKGYGVDAVADWIEGRHGTDYLVEIGGELRARGRNPRGQPWRVGIERPLDDGRAIERVIALGDRAMATSGDYRNFFEIDGRRYSHEIDPRTGRPIPDRLAGVTVVTDTCMRADAWATALMVLGPEAGLALARERGMAALFIVRSGAGFTETATDAMAALLIE